MRSITPLWLRCIVPAILLGCVSAGCASNKATQTPPEVAQVPAAADTTAAPVESDGPATAAPEDLPKGVVDAPDHFIVGAMGVSNAREPRAGEGCRNPMVDPRDGTTLKLVRSKDGRGDYEVPPGRYGVGDGKLLRLDCATGRIVAIVKR